MAYDTGSLSLAVNVVAGDFRIWSYVHGDPFSTVDDTDYFSDAQARGMQEGDWIIHAESDQDPPVVTLGYVSEIDATGNGTVSALSVGSSPSVTALTTASLTVSASAMIGDAAADVVGFYGTTAISQRASSLQATSNIASSTDFGATQLAVVQHIMETLRLVGLHKGSA